MDFNVIVCFLRDNWQYISAALVVVLEVVLLIVKRFKVNVKLPQSLYSQILEYVNEAEKTFGSGHGKEKLNYVVERYLQHNDVQAVFRTETEYWVKEIVENILSTPQKKVK